MHGKGQYIVHKVTSLSCEERQTRRAGIQNDFPWKEQRWSHRNDWVWETKKRRTLINSEGSFESKKRSICEFLFFQLQK